jgi:hypothetical protein
MRNWYGTAEWQRYCDRLPTDIETSAWEKWPDAGVCVALDHRLKVIDIDTDDSEMIAAVLAVLPDTPVKKAGAKGFSAFYRGSPAIVSQPFSVHNKRIIDLLCHGRQTVLPPTIHPDTLLPYQWITSETLLDTDIEQLPLLPDNIAQLLEEALAPYGYEPPSEFVHGPGDADSMWRELNETALLNLDRWVPALQLPHTKRSGGGYRAVAIWRNVENPNLSFHKDGIKDWGNDEAHTPINVVMKSFTTDLYTSVEWLRKQLDFKPSLPDADEEGFDFAGFIARAKAERVVPEIPLQLPELPKVEIVERPKTLAPVMAPRAKESGEQIDPWDVSTQGGLLGEITQWVLDTARVPVPQFATMASLAFLAAFYGRRYVAPTELGTNCYLIGIAGPGFGKDHPRKAIEILGHMSKRGHLIGPNEVTSDSAIEKTVRRRPCFVMPWDEVGIVLQAMSGKNAAGYARTVRKSLLELYSRSTAIWTGKEKADEEKDSSGDPVWFPTVSMIGFSTPSEFYKGITPDNLDDGFMARLTLVQATKRPGRRDARSLLDGPPDDLLQLLKLHEETAPKVGASFNGAAYRDSKQRPGMFKLFWSKEAKERWLGIEQWQLDFLDERNDYEGIMGRTAEQTLKYAMLRAISRNPTKPRCEVDDIEWAYAIVQQSIDIIDEGVREYLTSNDFEALHKTIYRFVKNSGEDGIARSEITRKREVNANVKGKHDYENAIKWLEMQELIETRITTGRGRPGARYFMKKDTVI